MDLMDEDMASQATDPTTRDNAAATAKQQQPRPYEPYTAAERIAQLSETDALITGLLRAVAASLSALGSSAPVPASGSASAGAGGDRGVVSADSEGSGNGTSKPAVTAEQRKAAFQSHMDSFLASLHAVDVQLRRSIMGLNEAGIIRLRPTTQSTVPLAAPVPGMPGAASSGPVVGGGGGGPPGPDDHHAASVYPTGSGTIGARLDVGWLNARGGKVEREMEAELWARARAFLEREAALGDASGLLSQDYDVGTHGRERKKEEEIGAGVDGSGDVEGDDDDDYDSDDNDDDESSEDDSDDGVDSDVNVKAEDTEMHGVDNPV